MSLKAETKKLTNKNRAETAQGNKPGKSFGSGFPWSVVAGP